jgi:AraC-like DNA-binding protein
VGIKFGMWSTILLLGSAHGFLVALLLLRARHNRLANRCLAALLVAVVLLITPYTIGYAGFYDAYPWLSFAPLDWRLGFGPLIYLYVRLYVRLYGRLYVEPHAEPRWPRRWAWHLAPAAIQGGYYAVVFAMPLAFKNDWDERVHVPWVVPVETWATAVSLVAYWIAAQRIYRRSQRWLEQNSAAREEHRMTWLRNFLGALAAMVAIQLGFNAIELAGIELDYFDRFPLYLAFTALVYYLGIEGWRNAERRVPSIAAGAPAIEPESARESAPKSAPAPEPEPVAAILPAAVNLPATPEIAAIAIPAPPDRDWTAQGNVWMAKILDAEWWREPELDLAELARRLGTNTRYLSRAFNEGLGLSFSELINRQRVEAAKRRLTEDGEILAIALDVGFASKASFNRAFKTFAGCTPSEYRGRARSQAAPLPGRIS